MVASPWMIAKVTVMPFTGCWPPHKKQWVIFAAYTKVLALRTLISNGNDSWDPNVPSWLPPLCLEMIYWAPSTVRRISAEPANQNSLSSGSQNRVVVCQNQTQCTICGIHLRPKLWISLCYQEVRRKTRGCMKIIKPITMAADTRARETIRIRDCVVHATEGQCKILGRRCFNQGNVKVRKPFKIIRC